MTRKHYREEARADLPGVAFDSIRKMLLLEVDEHGLTLQEDEPGQVTVETGYGLIGLREGVDTPVAGMVAASDSRNLFVMKNAMVEHLRTVLPDLAEAMRWSDSAEIGGFPPNFQFGQVTRVARLGDAFLRVTLKVEDVSIFGDESIHFRLVLPPRGITPDWPAVAPNGSTRWPKGPGAPHIPVYTVRSLDRASNVLFMDVFRHDGGRVTEWCEELHAGDMRRSRVGIVGPGGGGLVDAQSLLIASDETGFPAVARLIEGLHAGATAEMILETADGAETAYPIPAHEGVSVRWLSRRTGEGIADAALEALPGHPTSAIWFAGEKKDARRLRSAAKTMGVPGTKLHIAAFWAS